MIAAASNETEPFQLVVRAEDSSFREVDASVSDLVCAENGHRLPQAGVRLYRQQFVHVLQASAGIPWMPTIEYPDPLLPFRDPYSTGHEPYGAPFDASRIGSVGAPWFAGRRGPGFVFPSGVYTGMEDRRFVVQIEPGGRTFRWSDSWRDGFDDKVRVRRWNAIAVPLPPLGSDHRSLPLPLCDGVQAWFASGSEPAFGEGQTFHFNVYRRMNDVIWGEVHIPPSTPAGVYRGTITVSAREATPVSVPISLTVWDFELPRAPSVVTAFGGWMAPDFYSACTNADWLYELLLHEHRVDGQVIRGHETSWRNQFPSVDFTGFDAAAAGRLDGSLYPDGRPQKMFQLGMYGCGNEWDWENVAHQDLAGVKRFAERAARHLKQAGWFDRTYMYCRDEPQPEHFPAVLRDIAAFKEGDPGWAGKFMITAAPTPDHPLLDAIDIWCFKYHWAIDPELSQRLRNQGRRFWCYTANAPYAPNPTYHIDSIRGYEPRIIKWASWLRGAEGFLYWAAALDQEYPNPWTTPLNDFGACGDANLVYYGARDGPRLRDNATPLRPLQGPLPSFRLKQIREGLEDWEYLVLCERLRGRAFVESLAREIVPGGGLPYGKHIRTSILDGSWTQDPRRILAVREKLAEAIQEDPATPR